MIKFKKKYLLYLLGSKCCFQSILYHYSTSKCCHIWPHFVREWLQSDFTFEQSSQLVQALSASFAAMLQSHFIHNCICQLIACKWHRRTHKVENPRYFKLSFNIQASPLSWTPQLWAMSRLPLCYLLAVSRLRNCLFRWCWLSSETDCSSQYNCRGWEQKMFSFFNRAISYFHTLWVYMKWKFKTWLHFEIYLRRKTKGGEFWTNGAVKLGRANLNFLNIIEKNHEPFPFKNQ